MVRNLVSNAVKCTASGGQMEIRTRSAESWVDMAVSDSGIGIAEQDLARLFKEFQQLDAGVGKRQTGTGLGLALTKHFAEMHGGQVSAVSELGTGSTFILRLPLKPTTGQAAFTPVPAPAAAIDPSRPLVLVVEDNPQASEILARHLDAGGFRVELAHTGPDALRIARDLRPLAITLYILLPEVDGWEVLDRLQAELDTRYIPVSVVSVLDNPPLTRPLAAYNYFVTP